MKNDKPKRIEEASTIHRNNIRLLRNYMKIGMTKEQALKRLVSFRAKQVDITYRLYGGLIK